MSETTPIEPELEPTPMDAVIILGSLAAWSITLMIGLVLANVWIGSGSFLFLWLAVRVRKTGRSVPYDDTVVYSFPKIPDQWVNRLRWLGDNLALYVAVFIVIVGVCILFLLIATYPDNVLGEMIHLTAVILTMLTIGVFGSIANKLGYGLPSVILSLTGILLLALMVPIIWYVALLYGY